MEIWTSAISNWRRILAFGVEMVDITAKSGLECFAPEYQYVMEYKNGTMGEEEYTERYYRKMRQSFREHPVAWQTLLTKDKVAYVCYCAYETNGTRVFCHRHLFVNMLAKYLDREGVPYELKGELQ